VPVERTFEVEFLEEDLEEIRALMDEWSEGALAALVVESLSQFERDEASWKALETTSNLDTDFTGQELMRRETLALLISMRSRTVRTEMRMHELGIKVQALEARHAEKCREAETLHQATARLRRRRARIEEALRGVTPRPRASSPRSWLARFFTRGNV